jgi:PPOX class probable F420-dependent enzyme
MAARPGPERLEDDELLGLLATQEHCVMSTLKADGTPHLSNMVFHWAPEERLLRFTTRAGRLKVRHLTRDPRCSVLVSSDDHWSYTVVEGTAELTAVTTTPGDATGQELVLLHGEQPDREALFAELVEEQRLVIRLPAEHLYGARLPMPD